MLGGAVYGVTNLNNELEKATKERDRTSAADTKARQARTQAHEALMDLINRNDEADDE